MQRNAELRSLLDRFEGARIAVVGDLVADEYLYGETERVSREAPVLIVRYESSDVKAGCGANAVANLCALGARVLPVGLVGDDATGARLRQLLEEAGADVSFVTTGLKALFTGAAVQPFWLRQYAMLSATDPNGLTFGLGEVFAP